MHRPLLALLAAILWLLPATPARAAVTITFWSHELGNSFPHAFIGLRGVPDAGGTPVDGFYGFTARSISPAILMGTVKGRIDYAKPAYVHGSDVRFALTLTDAQYAAIVSLVKEWSEDGGDSRYNLNNRNCIHFVAEAARRAGLTGLDHPNLMKRPRSYLQAVGTANAGRVVALGIPGKAYLTALPPISATPQILPVHGDAEQPKPGGGGSPPTRRP